MQMSANLDYIKILTGALPEELRPNTGDGEVPLCFNHADNADFVRDHAAVTCLALGVTYSGHNMTAEDVRLLQEYADNLPDLTDENAASTALTDADRARVEEVALIRSVYALRIAHTLKKSEAAAVAPVLKPGNRVRWVTDNGHEKDGVVETVSLTDSSCVVTFTHAGGQDDTAMGTVEEFELIPNPSATPANPAPMDVDSSAPPARTVAPVASTTTASDSGPHASADGERNRVDSERELHDVKLGRKRIAPNPTLTHAVAHGCSSKHHTAADQALDAMMPALHLPIWPIEVDFEFVVRLYNRRFVNGDPLMVFPAWGHFCKSQSVSSMANNKPLTTQRLTEAASQELRDGTPPSNRLYKGRNIRTTVRYQCRELMALHVAAAERYLRLHPDRKAIRSVFAAPGTIEGLTIDENARPLALFYSDAQLRVATDFHRQLRADVGADVPTTIVCDSPAEVLHWTDASQQLAEQFGCDRDIVVQVTARLSKIPWTRTSGAEDSLRDHIDCANVSLKSAQGVSLAKKAQRENVLCAYLLAGLAVIPVAKHAQLLGSPQEPEKLSFADCAADADNAIDSDVDSAIDSVFVAQLTAAEAAGQAAAFDAAQKAASAPSSSMPKVPDNAKVNLAILVQRLLFEGAALSMLILQTRVRDPNLRKTIERKLSTPCAMCAAEAKTSCRCSSKFDLVVALKANSLVAFTRNQPNYQRACALALLQLMMVLATPNFDLAVILMLMWEASPNVTLYGDTFLAEPVDLQQESQVRS